MRNKSKLCRKIKEPFVRPRHKLEGNITVCLKQMGCNSAEWVTWLSMGTSGNETAGSIIGGECLV